MKILQWPSALVCIMVHKDFANFDCKREKRGMINIHKNPRLESYCIEYSIGNLFWGKLSQTYVLFFTKSAAALCYGKNEKIHIRTHTVDIGNLWSTALQKMLIVRGTLWTCSIYTYIRAFSLNVEILYVYIICFTTEVWIMIQQN